MKTADFDYQLPPEFIAQTPLEPRDASRLLVLQRDSGRVGHHHFWDLGRFLKPGDLVILNETRVIPARLYGSKIPTGGRVEILLLQQKESHTWEALVGGRGLKPGRAVLLEDGLEAEIVRDLGGPRRLVKFSEPIEPLLDKIGHVPLPPYIHTPLDTIDRYQTVYAHKSGSAAAPTAGLHFTEDLIAQLKNAGINFASVILHVGLDTFAPVTEDDPREHIIHTEWCQLPSRTANLIRQTKQAGGRLIAVGTTSVRTLETSARVAEAGQIVTAFDGPTDLYILPGFNFRVVDAIITNFHLPRSTLIMLVSAFASRELILGAYEIAKQKGYRFYSFGDAMLIT